MSAHTSFALHQLLPVPQNIPVSQLPAAVRLRYLPEGGIRSGWVRPGVHCDGNPLNLSQPVRGQFAEMVVRAAGMQWTIDPIDEHALPIDPARRLVLIDWFKTRYGIDVPQALHEVPAPPPEPNDVQAPEGEPPALPDAPVISDVPSPASSDPAAPEGPPAGEGEPLRREEKPPETTAQKPAAPAAPAPESSREEQRRKRKAS